MDDRYCIQTYTGKKFSLVDPSPDDICIEDIAHALSMKCRFSGHSREFYSVAQHSYYASTLCKNPLYGLLHDAAEAYLPDVVKPLKDRISDYEDIEGTVQIAILRKYGQLVYHLARGNTDMHEVDYRLCATEKAALMLNTGWDWSLLKGFEPYSGLYISCWTPRQAEFVFLKRFCELSSVS